MQSYHHLKEISFSRRFWCSSPEKLLEIVKIAIFTRLIEFPAFAKFKLARKWKNFLWEETTRASSASPIPHALVENLGKANKFFFPLL